MVVPLLIGSVSIRLPKVAQWGLGPISAPPPDAYAVPAPDAGRRNTARASKRAPKPIDSFRFMDNRISFS